jgi:hypothetical protein
MAAGGSELGLELLQVPVEVAADVVFDGGAGDPEVLPVGQLGDDASTLVPDRRRGVSACR